MNNLITSSKPDISIGQKTWLNKPFLSLELFPATLFEDKYKEGKVVVVVNV